MMRDEKGRFASHVEMTDEQREAICYKSKLLNRYFDSYQEMVEAETKFKVAQAAKEKASNAKKEDAKKVEEAYKETIKVRQEAYKKIEEANNTFEKLRNEFIKKYGVFHMTYTDKDGVTTSTVDISDIFSDCLGLIDYIFR